MDFRYALRTLRRSPGFAATAVLTLALGIGANTAMFSVIRAVFLRPLDFPESDRLVVLWESNPERSALKQRVGQPNFVDWEAQNRIFEDMGFTPGPNWLHLVGPEGAERVRGVYVSSGYFRALGIKPMLGRTFLPEEDRRRDQRPAVVSFTLWRQRFGGNPGVLGKTIEVDTFRGGTYTIVGVMPQGFEFPYHAQIWLPVAYWGGGPPPPPDSPNRCCQWLEVVGRLKPGVSIEQARSEMSGLARRISERYPEAYQVSAVTVTPLREDLTQSYQAGLYALFGAVVAVLFIAGANVAGLLLSRALARQHEVAIRVALGATRARIVRQFLAESLLLATAGAAGGIVIAIWTRQLLVAIFAGRVPLVERAQIDWSVLAYTGLLTAAIALFCGLAPVSQLEVASRRTSTAGAPSLRLRHALVVAEVALAVILVAIAGLMTRSLIELERVDPGFRPEKVLAVSFDLTTRAFRGPGNQQPYFHELLERVEALPGVRMAAGTTEVPLAARSEPRQPITLEGEPLRAADQSPRVIQQGVTPAYFAVLGIRLMKGRFFTEDDRSDGKIVAIVNETAARRYWPGQDPVGKRFGLGSRERFGYFRIPPRPGEPEWREIVGVVSDVRTSGLDRDPQPEVYFTYRQYPWYDATLVVRTTSEPLLLAEAIRREAKAVNPNAVITSVKTMEQIAAESIEQPRDRAKLIGGFSAVALALAMMGIYGVMSYAVAQRTREIGIRMALGARTEDIAGMILARAMRLAGAGIVIGLAAALAAARWVSSLLYGVGPADKLTIAGTCVLLGLTAVAATYLPARRAMRVDPAVALREE